ncbi:MAG TPA: YdcF family protein [Candidatus Saccharimonadia bacterium]|nr:YdcF family protein [Candidatus Saccharimonadia bacterium]
MKRFLLGTMVVSILLVAAVAGGFFGLGFYLSPQDPLAKTDAIVAISGGETDARVDEAVRLYQDGWAPRIIFSGAALDPTGPSNAKAMADRAIAAGVPTVDITLDETSADTRQNATNVAAIVHRAGYRSITLVTSPYHQRRAYILFQRVLGPSFGIVNHSSYDQAWRRSDWWATAYSRSLTLSELQKVLYELASGNSQ